MTGISPTRVIGGRYVVLGELPRCRTGGVWRAQDRVTGREVAVKELRLPARTAAGERNQFRERLLRAARAAGRVDATGIVTVYDVFVDDDVDHVVTELVEAPAMVPGKPLGERTATEIGRQLAEALAVLHDAGVVHGGVAPESVLIGPGPRVRLADLGVNETVGERPIAPEPAYLPPESAKNGTASAEADIWALGTTMHVALRGRPPGDHADPAASAPLAGVLTGMLHRSPNARLTAGQVVALLDPDERPAAPGRTARRVRRAAIMIAAAVLAGVLGYLLGRTGLTLPEVIVFGRDLMNS